MKKSSRRPDDPATARPLGREQARVLTLLRAEGAYIRRQTHEGYLRSWLWYDGRRMELGVKPTMLPNRFVDSLVKRDLLERAPTENTYSDDRAGMFRLRKAGGDA